MISKGEGELLGWMDPDEARLWMRDHKSRVQQDKRMPLSEAVRRFTRDGDYFALGGFGHIRVSMAAIYEMIRQGRRNLAMAAKTAVHDVDVLIGGGWAYFAGIELPTGSIEELSGNEAAARAARDIGFHVMGYFPITPSTEVAETLSKTP